MWSREEHKGRSLRPGDRVSFGEVVEIERAAPARHAPVPEQDVREMARAQRLRLCAPARDERDALLFAQAALERQRRLESRWARARRRLLEWLEGVQP